MRPVVVEADTYQRLWGKIETSDSVEDVTALLDRLDILPTVADAVALNLGDVKARGFHRLQQLTSDDPASALRLILDHLLPFCQRHFPETESDMVIAQRHSRETLREWLNQYPDEDRIPLRERVLDALHAGLVSAAAEDVGDTVAVIGFRRDDIIEVLRGLANSDDEQGDAALSNLVALGVPAEEREPILDQLHARLAQRCNQRLIFSLTRLADPRSVDPVRDRLQRPDEHGAFLLRVLSAIADRWDADDALQDRIGQVFVEVLGTYKDRFARELYLGSDVLPRCNSAEVVRWLLQQLTMVVGDDERAANNRWHLYLRLADCIRPRQVEGWSGSAEHFPKALDLVRGDACQNSKMSGRSRTFEYIVKEEAWETAFRFGSDQILSWYDLAADPRHEQNALARRHITSRLACFRFQHLPPLVHSWITEEFDATGHDDDGELVARLAAIRLAQSAATAAAFDALLECGVTMDGKVPLATVEALGDVAAVLVRSGDEAVIQQLVAAASETPVRRRMAAAGALEQLALYGALPPGTGQTLATMANEETRDIFERSALVGALGYLSKASAQIQWLPNLKRMAQADDWLGWRALETLARFDWLADDEQLLTARLGLGRRGKDWDWVLNRPRMEWAAFALGLLYRDHPQRFTPAVATAIAEGDWRSVGQLTPFLARHHQQPGGPFLPEPIKDAILQRAHRRQRTSFAELDLFTALVTAAPDTFALERWDSSWSEWPPDSRAALANALRRAAYTDDKSKAAAESLLVLLVQDSSFGVRRAAYRGLGQQFPETLGSLCAAWIGADLLHLRVRAAEAAAWLPDHTTALNVTDVYSQLQADREPAVRKAVERARQEHRERSWTSSYLARVRQGFGEDNAAQLEAWAYGQALARIGDDALSEELHQLADAFVAPHLHYWLEDLAENVDKHWHDVTRDWNEPKLTAAGVIERYEAIAILSDGRELPIRVALWAHPAAEPTLTPAWGGTGSVASIDGLGAFMDTPNEQFVLRLEDGREGQVGVDGVSFGGTVTFRGLGAYPARQEMR